MTPGEPLRPRGAILAGGKASRYGGHPKGLVEVGGVAILDRLVAGCREAFGEAPLLVANHPEAATWHPGLTVVPDGLADAGTLGGLLTAIEFDPRPVVCVAWDMPFVTAPLLARLGRDLDRFDAVLPESDGPRGIEPLCAGYAAAAAPAIREAIARGDLRAIGFHGAIRVARVPAGEVRGFGDPTTLFFNVNTPADAAAADRLADRVEPA